MKTRIVKAIINCISGSRSKVESPSTIFIVELMHGIRMGSEIGKRRKTIKSLFPSEKMSSAEVRQPSSERPTDANRKIRNTVRIDDACKLTFRKIVAEPIRVSIISVWRTRQ